MYRPATVLLIGLAAAWSGQAMAEPDLKESGHQVAVQTRAAVDAAGKDLKQAGHEVAVTTRKTVHKVKHAVKRGVHRAAVAIDTGARRVEAQTRGD